MSKGIDNPNTWRAGKEGIESPELFRGTLAFDFIFSRDENGVKHPFCVEINGHAAGGPKEIEDIKKIEDDKNRQIVTRLRFLNTPEYHEHMRSIKNDPDISEDERRSRILELDRAPKKHAFANPPYIAEVTNDKEKQQQFIPPENKPREYRVGESPISSTGLWVCKPRHGEMGEGILILDNKEFQEWSRNMNEDFVVQEFIYASPPDNAPEGMADHIGSMRLHLDFQYLQNGKIKLVYMIAFQRVALSQPTDPLQMTNHLDREKAFIINAARGEEIAPASDEEKRLALPIAEQIIHNLATRYRESLETSES